MLKRVLGSKRFLRKITAAVLCLALAAAVVVWAVNAYVRDAASGRILAAADAALLQDADCILVLGCGVREDGTPSDMLSDRLECGLDLYRQGAAPKLLFSGDHGQQDYNEVGVMKQYAIAADVASEDVFMDHAGFSTYESMYRAKEIFGVDRAIIVTQDYHLYRALYVAGCLGLDAYGVAADRHIYRGQSLREVREVLARCKDFITSLYQPLPQYLGDAIPISGSGDLTNDY